MKIGELAKNTGVSVQTIRYYEKQGILPKAPRTESGYRTYDKEVIDIILFIKHAQDLGFTLAKIKRLLKIKSSKNLSGSSVKEFLEQEIDEINKKLTALNIMKRSLSQLNQSCSGDMPVCECPILKSIQTPGKTKKKR